MHESRLLILSFQKFNEIIDSSEAEADLAEANITEIERLISSANNKSDEATANLGDAQELAEEAASTAEGAGDIANQTQQVRSGLSQFSKFSAPTIVFLAFCLAKKLRL